MLTCSSVPVQAFEAIPLLQQRFPIARAMMRVAISVPLSHRADLADVLQQAGPSTAAASAAAGAPAEAGGAVVEEEDLVGDAYTVTALIQPGTFRNLYNYVSQRTGGAGRLDVVAVSAQDVAAGARKDGAAASAAPGASSAGAAAAAGAAVALGAMSVGAPAAGGAVAGGYSAAVGSGMVVPAAARPRAGPTGEVRGHACLSHSCFALSTHRHAHPAHIMRYTAMHA